MKQGSEHKDGSQKGKSSHKSLLTNKHREPHESSRNSSDKIPAKSFKSVSSNQRSEKDGNQEKQSITVRQKSKRSEGMKKSTSDIDQKDKHESINF